MGPLPQHHGESDLLLLTPNNWSRPGPLRSRRLQGRRSLPAPQAPQPPLPLRRLPPELRLRTASRSRMPLSVVCQRPLQPGWGHTFLRWDLSALQELPVYGGPATTPWTRKWQWEAQVISSLWI